MTAQSGAGVREGDLLAGKYRIDKVLGTGGMGVVVAAHHIELDEKVAIKFLLPEVLDQAEAVARFSREARAAVKIKSEHVAKVSDVGRLENGAPYMVMEYLEGANLATWLAQRGALPVEQAVEFILQACEAIAEAHVLRIVHRDLKPANLFLIRRADGVLSVKVLDFGISKMGIDGPDGDAAMTKTSALLGSPLYMSPEQLESSKGVDARSDIWALGVILYELITGKQPFRADTLAGLALRITQSAPTPMQSHRSDVPDAVAAVILKCLHKSRDDRYASVSELAAALSPFANARARISVERISGVMGAAGSSQSVFSPLTPARAELLSATQTAANFGTTAPPKRHSTWFVAGLLGLAILVIFVVWGRSRTTASEQALQATAATASPSAALPPSNSAVNDAAPASAASPQPTPTPATPIDVRPAEPVAAPSAPRSIAPPREKRRSAEPSIFDGRK